VEQQQHHIKNFNDARGEEIIKAVYPGVYCGHCREADALGNHWHVTTDELWQMGMVLGSAKTIEDAWADVHIRYKENIWGRVRGGHYTRNVTLGGEKELVPPPPLPPVPPPDELTPPDESKFPPPPPLE
jgi:hypothetical protein